MSLGKKILWLICLFAFLTLTASSAHFAAAPLRLEVDLSERKLFVYHGGERVETYDVAIGDPNHPTPTGSFTIDRIIWDPSWVPPDSKWAKGATRKAPDDPDNPMEAAKLFFRYPAYYIHGTNAPQTIGDAASHGCIRMHPADVEALAKRVQEHGGEPRSADWYEKVKRREAPSVEIKLPDPVPLEIHN